MTLTILRLPALEVIPESFGLVPMTTAYIYPDELILRSVAKNLFMSSPEFPLRREGSHHDTVSMYCLDGGVEEAFDKVKARLYDINAWKELNKAIRTDFQLCDGSGTRLERMPAEGDYIRLDLAGPGSPAGGGYDWVQITSIGEGTETEVWASLKITPCPNPTTDASTIAHFYAAGATNTFVVRRVGQCILAEVHGRNEKPNVAKGPVVDRLRNEAVALAGKVGVGKMQWKDWTDGMISVIQPKSDG